MPALVSKDHGRQTERQAWSLLHVRLRAGSRLSESRSTNCSPQIAWLTRASFQLSFSALYVGVTHREKTCEGRLLDACPASLGLGLRVAKDIGLEFFSARQS